MKRFALALLVLSVACGSAAEVAAPPAPPPTTPEDPPAMVHAINQTSATYVAWLLVIGSDANHSAVSPQSLVGVGASGERCMFSASVPGDRRFVYAAVAPGSALDKRLMDLSSGADASVAFRDSLSKNQINLTTFLAANPGLVANTPVFDPAPLGYSPADTVPWRWTVTAPSATTIVVDSSDHTCTRKL